MGDYWFDDDAIENTSGCGMIVVSVVISALMLLGLCAVCGGCQSFVIGLQHGTIDVTDSIPRNRASGGFGTGRPWDTGIPVYVLSILVLSSWNGKWYRLDT